MQAVLTHLRFAADAEGEPLSGPRDFGLVLDFGLEPAAPASVPVGIAESASSSLGSWAISSEMLLAQDRLGSARCGERGPLSVAVNQVADVSAVVEEE